jgi:sugar fermentation stimulation protein A
VLLIRLPRAATIRVGRLGEMRFRAGTYAYVGSAMGGLRGRLRRHMRLQKRRRWHVDYVLDSARVTAIVTCETEERSECTIAGSLAGRFWAIPGFGASDCSCPGHLFRATGRASQTIMADLSAAGMDPVLWRDPGELMP